MATTIFLLLNIALIFIKKAVIVDVLFNKRDLVPSLLIN